MFIVGTEENASTSCYVKLRNFDNILDFMCILCVCVGGGGVEKTKRFCYEDNIIKDKEEVWISNEIPDLWTALCWQNESWRDVTGLR